MNISLPGFVLQIIQIFEKNNFEIYIVGGVVRDLLTSKPTEDWDFATNATPEQMLEILPTEAFYDNAFGTVMLPLEHLLTPVDITTYRTEHGYTDKRRPDKVVWGSALTEDLMRRDFTINSLAIKVKLPETFQGSLTDENLYMVEIEITDEYNGQKDLINKIIRAVGDPNARFSEDALRMMRAVRIASQLGFSIEPDTLDAIKSNASQIQKIAKERVRDELFKILLSPKPDKGILMLRESGLLQEILPELEKTFDVEQKSPGRHHIDDVGTHLIKSLKEVRSEDPIVRFATLIHDIGKPQTFKILDSGTITFYNHEIVGGRITKQIAERLKLSKKQKDKLWRLVRYHQFTVNEQQTDAAIRRFIRHVTPELIDDMLELRRADRIGSGATETSWRTEEFKKKLVEVQKQPFTVHDLKIDGNDVMRELNLKPGREVGEILTKLYKDVIAKKVENEKGALMERLKELDTN